MTHNLKSLSIRDYIIVVMGIFSTMPIIAVKVGSHYFSVFSIVFALVFIFKFTNVLKGKLIRIPHNSYYLNIWLVEILFSCITGAVFLSFSDVKWAVMAFSCIPKVLLFLFFSLIWNIAGNIKLQNNLLAKGFIIGCILNCMWSIVDALGFYIFKKSLNNMLFSGQLMEKNIRIAYDGAVSLIQNGMIRSGGFNYDPAQLGFIAPVVVCYGICKKNYWLVILAMGAILASASTTSLLSSILVITVNIPNYNFKFERLKKFKVKIIFIVFLLILFFFSQVGFEFISIVGNAYDHMSNRVNSTYLNPEKQDIRMFYALFLPIAVFHVIPYMFLGSGIGTASLGYARAFEFRKFSFPYDMENTYIALLLDTGIIGFFIYFLIIVKLYKTYKYPDFHDTFGVIVWSFLLSMLFSNLSYHYLIFAPQVLMMIVAFSEKNYFNLHD